MPPRELHLLHALAWMCQQYMSEEWHGRNVLDHMCMGAGEDACEALLAYGLIDSADRGATWTELGKDLLDLNLNQRPFPS